jgi:hypothetical protein
VHNKSLQENRGKCNPDNIYSLLIAIENLLEMEMKSVRTLFYTFALTKTLYMRLILTLLLGIIVNAGAFGQSFTIKAGPHFSKPIGAEFRSPYEYPFINNIRMNEFNKQSGSYLALGYSTRGSDAFLSYDLGLSVSPTKFNLSFINDRTDDTEIPIEIKFSSLATSFNVEYLLNFNQLEIGIGTQVGYMGGKMNFSTRSEYQDFFGGSGEISDVNADYYYKLIGIHYEVGLRARYFFTPAENLAVYLSIGYCSNDFRIKTFQINETILETASLDHLDVESISIGTGLSYFIFR